MKHHERRAAGAYPYFKLLTWDTQRVTWRAGKVIFESRAEAGRAATQPGKYRIESFDGSGNEQFEPFEV